MVIQRSLRRSIGSNAVGAARQWLCPQCVSPSTYPFKHLKELTQSQNQASRIIPIAQQRRSVYTIPKLSQSETFEKNGVDGLFSADGYSLGWTRYQEMMITRLNELTAGRSFADRDVKELAIRFAHNPMTASTFNHASMAHNNHFFYQQFSGTPRRLEDYPELGNSLVNQFGSITTLRKTFLDTAANMFGPGFVWLVWARDPQDSGFKSGSWKVLCTYNAGSPYPEAGFMQQGLDMNTNNAQSFQQYKSSMIMGYMGNNSELARERARLPPGGTTVMPVLCVSVWEHTYIYDFGIGGKNNYLNDFWNVIDWHVIANRAPPESRAPTLDVSTPRSAARV